MLRAPLLRRLDEVAGRPDRGAASAEYVGAILVVVALVASVIIGATPIGGTIAEKLCEAFGGSSCGSVSAGQDHEPEGPCTVSTDDTNLSGKVSIAFVDIGDEGTLSVEKMSDGTYRVTVGGDLGAQVVATAGEAKGGLTIGDYGGSIDLSANAGVGGFLGAGAEYDFKNKADKDKFVDYIQRNVVKSGATGLASSLTGGAAGIAAPVLGWLYDKVTGYHYSPPGPTSTYYEGGTSASASAAADAIVAGGSASADYKNALGVKIDQKSGDITVYNKIDLSADAAAKLGLSDSDPNWGRGASGEASVQLVVGTTTTKDGVLKTVQLDGAATADGSFALTSLTGTPLQGTGGRGITLSASFDVTDGNRAAVLASLATLASSNLATGGATGATPAIPFILDQAHRSGDISVETLDVSSQNLLSAALSLKAPAIGGLGFEIGASTNSQNMLGAYYLSPTGWKEWTSCAG